MVVLLADREVIIHDHLLQYALVEDPGHVNAVFVDLKIWKDCLHSVLLLGEACDGA